MNRNISIIIGDTYARSLLDDVINNNRDVSLQLGSVLQNLDELLEKHENITWWVAIEESEAVGLLASYNLQLESHLMFAWINAISVSEYEEITTELVRKWKSSTHVINLYADISPNSTLISGLINSGFSLINTLISANNVDTKIDLVDYPPYISLRKPTREDLENIYDQLIEPGLLQGTSTFITKEQFLSFSNRTIQMEDNWVIVENIDNGELLGVGAAFLEDRGDGKKPYLYGPHATSPEVEQIIISEFLAYWKMKDFEIMRIFKFGIIDDQTRDRFNIIQNDNFSLVRYKLQKRKSFSFFR